MLKILPFKISLHFYFRHPVYITLHLVLTGHLYITPNGTLTGHHKNWYNYYPNPNLKFKNI